MAIGFRVWGLGFRYLVKHLQQFDSPLAEISRSLLEIGPGVNKACCWKRRLVKSAPDSVTDPKAQTHQSLAKPLSSSRFSQKHEITTLKP